MSGARKRRLSFDSYDAVLFSYVSVRLVYTQCAMFGMKQNVLFISKRPLCGNWSHLTNAHYFAGQTVTLFPTKFPRSHTNA